MSFFNKCYYYSCTNQSKKKENRCLGGATISTLKSGLFKRKTSSARRSKSSTDPITNEWIFEPARAKILSSDDFTEDIKLGTPHCCEYKYSETFDERKLYHTLKVRIFFVVQWCPPIRTRK